MEVPLMINADCLIVSGTLSRFGPTPAAILKR
jgi:hypothetical protein